MVHVNDASRAVGVVSSLLSNRNGAFISELKADYADFREKFLNRQVDKEYISIEEARNQNSKSIGKMRPSLNLKIQVFN